MRVLHTSATRRFCGQQRGRHDHTGFLCCCRHDGNRPGWSKCQHANASLPPNLAWCKNPRSRSGLCSQRALLRECVQPLLLPAKSLWWVAVARLPRHVPGYSPHPYPVLTRLSAAAGIVCTGSYILFRAHGRSHHFAGVHSVLKKPVAPPIEPSRASLLAVLPAEEVCEGVTWVAACLDEADCDAEMRHARFTTLLQACRVSLFSRRLYTMCTKLPPRLHVAVLWP